MLILTTSFPRWRGDHRAPFILEAARALTSHGACVQVVAVHQPGAKREEDWEGVHIVRPRYLPQRWEVLQAEEGGLPIAWRAHRLRRLAFAPFLATQTIAAARYGKGADIIHANWTLSGAAALLSLPSHRKPIILTVQGSDVYQAAHIPLFRLATRMILSRVDKVLVISNALMTATTLLGVPRQNISLIPNGVDTDVFTPGIERVEGMVLSVGSLIRRKGHDVLIRAMGSVVKADARARLYLVGDGPEREPLAHLVRDLHLEPHVHFLGAQPPDRVAELMRRAKVFVLPSREEGQGVVALEALASGTPCAVSSVGGIPEMVTPDVGIAVAPEDTPALADSILRILDDSALWARFSASGRRRAVEHYSWARIGALLMAEYRSALQTRR